MGRRSLSIRLHLAIYGALIVLPLLAAGLLIAKLYVNKERAVLTAQAHDIVADATAAIDQQLNGYKLALQVLASSEALTDSNFQQLYQRAKQLSDSIAGSAIALRRADGEGIFLTSQPFGAPVPQTTDAGLLAADRLAVQQRSPVISDLISGGMHPNYVALVVPAVSYGKADYLLTLGIPPKGILDILTSRLGAEDWLLRVIDNNDRIIARSWDNERFAGQTATDEFIRDTQERAGSFIRNTLDAVPVFNVYRRSELSDWRVVAGIPLSELEAPLYRSLTVLAIVAGIGLAGAIILALLYARLLSRPLRQLQGLAEAREANEIPTGIAELDGVAGTLMRSMVVLKDRDRMRTRLVNELNHRMKNMLAIIQAIADQTRRRASSLDQFGKAFEGRLLALARSHEAIGDRGWHSGDLGTLVAQGCKPFCDEARLDLQGPPVELSPKAAVGIGMVIHELATNAAKYGALSTPGGKIKVHWDLPEETGLRILRLQWQEQTGAPIAMPSSRKEGFGSVLLRSIIESDLGGRLDITFARDGLRCIVCVPMNALVAPLIVSERDEAEAAGAGRR